MGASTAGARWSPPLGTTWQRQLDKRSTVCTKAESLGFDSMRKRLSLGPWRRPCS